MEQVNPEPLQGSLLNSNFDLVHNSNSQILMTCFLLVAWALLYATINVSFTFKSLKKKQSDDTKNRMISIVHGALSFWFAVSQYLPYPIFDKQNTSFQIFICLFSLSYCVYDLIACVYYHLSDMALISHHLFCILGFLFSAFTGYGAIYAIGGLFVAQSSNFWMHSRIILRTFNLKNTKGYEYSQNIYLALYILFRGIICPLMVWYPCVLSQNCPLVVQLMCTALTIQSFYFIYQMGQVIKRKNKRSKQMKQKNIQFQWFHEDQGKLSGLSFYKKKQAQNIF